MTANQIELFATPDAYEFLKAADNQQAIRIMKIVNEMIGGDHQNHRGYGFGTSPLMLVSKEFEPPAPSVILLYKSCVDFAPNTSLPGKLLKESNEIYRDFDAHLETAIPVHLV